MADTDMSTSSSRGRAHSLADFRGKVPVVLVFVGPLDPDDAELADLDRHQVDFGHERVQLLVAAHAAGADVRAVPARGLDLPVLADPHDDLLAAFGEEESTGAFAVILDKKGDLVERLPLAGGAEALVARVRELAATLHA